jgi:CMP-N,N'-diacetyllegionaminic acid synthase
MKMLLLIPARGGSKGIAKKNLASLGGMPLIAWTIKEALASQVGRVIVSTDCERIADSARQAGAEVPFLRPAELAADDTPSFDVAAHAVDWWRESNGAWPETLVLLQPTSPFRSAEDIVAGVKLLENSSAPAVVAVCEARTHPYLSRKIGPDGIIEYFLEGSEQASRRQDFPPAYQINGALYVIRTQILLAEKSFQPRGTRAYVMPPERSLDIDNAADLRQADWQLTVR